MTTHAQPKQPSNSALSSGIALLALWFVGCVIVQKGLGGIGWLAFTFYGCLLLASLVRRIRPKYRLVLPAGLFMVPIIGWFFLFRSYIYPRDLVAFMLAVVLVSAAVLAIHTQRRSRSTLLSSDDCSGGSTTLGIKTTTVLLPLCLLSFWLLVSLMDFQFASKPLRLDPNRFATLGRPEWKGLHIGVALSGGGYRAAILHAGVLKALEEQGVRVTSLSGVSGGSIIGSYYSLGGTPEEFVTAVKSGDLCLTRALVEVQNAIRLPFPAELPWLNVRLLPGYDFSRSDVQANLINRLLLRDQKVGDAGNPFAPRSLICTTDLRHGIQVGFLSEGVLLVGPRAQRFVEYLNRDSFPLSERQANIVAASGAFPGAFPPKLYTIAIPPVPLSPLGVGEVSLALADGGVLDNLGLRMLQEAHLHAEQPATKDEGALLRLVSEDRLSNTWRQDVILISDGSNLLQDADTQGTVDSVSRAIELAGSFAPIAGVGERELFHLTHDERLPPLLWLSPGQRTEAPDERVRGFSLSALSDEASQSRSRPTVAFEHLSWASSFTDEISRRMVELNPDREKTLRLYSSYTKAMAMRKEGTYPSPHTTRDGSSSRNTERLLAGTARDRELASGGTEGLALSAAVLGDIDSCLGVFQRLPTLDDNPTASDADAVFRLGQYLVLLNWDRIEDKLDEISENRGNTIPERSGSRSKMRAFFKTRRAQTTPESQK